MPGLPQDNCVYGAETGSVGLLKRTKLSRRESSEVVSYPSTVMLHPHFA